MSTKKTIEIMRHERGYTLVELMIVVAILAILAGIAIPTYNGYVSQSRISSARANVEPLRLALEDYWLNNGQFVADGTNANWVWNPLTGVRTLQTGPLNWTPDPNDSNNYIYDVTVANVSGVNTYNITVTHIDGGSVTVSGVR